MNKAITIAIASVALGTVLSSPVAIADQQIQDDLVVVGSICAGFDCVNGESFGFDTLRLKENNLRIKFQDTSSSSSFPTVDWQITANDSSNGGLNKFSIDEIDSGRTPFTLVSGAPSNSLYITNSGNIGLNTTTPLVKLHVKDGNTPTLRLHQDGSSGFAEQIWDIGSNEANFFVRDVTNGSQLPFRIVPSAPNNSLYIAADGDIGFETSTPDGILDIAHPNDANNHAILLSPTADFGINIDNGQLPMGLFDVQTTGGKSRFTVISDGDVGIGTSTPSGRFEIRDLNNTLSYFDVDASGDVGIGTAAPIGRFEVKSSNGATPYFSVAADGKIGFGTNASAFGSMFHIKQATGSMITYTESADNSAVQLRIMSNSDNRRLIAVNSSDTVESQLVLGNASVKLAGNSDTVNLYATFSASGLSVNGPISTSASGQVHPDYVFKDDYDLMDLSTLKTFIQENHHLPEVPSESDVAKDGLNMTQMQITLLKKVEELTLYVIQQQEAIELLNNKLFKENKAQ